MNNTRIPAVISCIALLATSACASIVSDKNYQLTLDSVPSGANVEVVNEDGVTEFRGTTPTTCSLRAGKAYFDKQSYTVKMTKEGHEPYQQQVNSSIDGWYWGNLIAGGVIGFFIVDPLTGAMFELDEKAVTASLREQAIPTPSAASTARASLAPPPKPLTLAQEPPAEPDDIAESLQFLKNLREQGLISEEEYQQKRKEKLDAL
ncbi:MAG: PEGA domain-containing protein [Bdellovibrionales bacterium]|nr:PEGA domain-containing protein [Bdellovibrionales bacterium]